MTWVLLLLPWGALLGTTIASFVQAFTPWRPRSLFVRNAGVLWTILVCLFIIALTIASRVIYVSGGCAHGLKAPVDCASIDNGLGQIVHDIVLLNIVAGPYLILGALIAAIIAEALTRQDHQTG